MAGGGPRNPFGGRLRLRLRLLLLPLLLLPPPRPAARSPGLPPHGERVIPHWLLRGRSRRAVSVAEKVPAPARGDVVVTAEGKELILALRRNDRLLLQNYTETHYVDGQPVTLSPSYTDHCYYHGHVRGYKDSWVVLSTCSGIRGLIVLNVNDTYYLKPLGSPEPEHHIIYRAEHLPIKGGTCGHSDPLGGSVADFTRLVKPEHQRAKRDAWRTLKYMELFIVADHTLFRNQNFNLGHTKQRILEIANYVDKFYRSLNIKVALIGLEVWTERDQCTVTSDANASLWSFLAWKKTLRSRKKHDNAQLLTGRTFYGTTIGMAPLEGMCSADNSGGVSMDHSDLPVGAAATMAHEIGHNFGMSHDSEGCCVEARPDQGGCIMAAATGHPFPRVFSSCSRRQLESYFQKGGGMCLFNMPNTKDLVVGRKCGNGFLEDGEECDCGELEECTSPCCNAHNCTLKAGAQCAHGDCCQNCKLKTAGTMCREPAGSCDLPEYCTGASPYCPANVYLLDGSACASGEAYCSNGMCMTHHQQCVQLWGPGRFPCGWRISPLACSPCCLLDRAVYCDGTGEMTLESDFSATTQGAWPAPDACFQDVNRAGDAYGNCGKDSQGHYVKCDWRDAKCGKIQCQSSAKKPKGTNTVSMDTTIRFNGREVKCRGAFMYATKDDEGDMSDPGLVMTGTKCGDGKVCKDRRCQNASFFELEKCISQCHGHGVCNSNKNCHCSAGWAPPYCEKPGLGGSVDSGPVQHDNHEAILVALLLVFLLILPAVALGIYFCYRRQNSLLSKWIKGARKSQETRRSRAVGQKGKEGHSNAAFTLQDVSSSGKAANSSHKATRSIFPLKSSAPQNGSQPVNVVRPLRPAPSPAAQPHRDLKPSRPPPPAGKSVGVPAKTTSSQPKLLPPKKPLPINPVRTPVTIPKHAPPCRPLPGNPLLAKSLPAERQTLLVMVPPTSMKATGTSLASHLPKPGPPQRPIPGFKVQSTFAPFKK